MKHYYNDDGSPNYVVPREQIVRLAELDMEFLMANANQCGKVLSRYQGIVAEVELGYRLAESLGGLGGSPTLTQWRDEPRRGESELQRHIRDMWLQYRDAGYLACEFLLLLWNVVAELCVTYLLGGACGNEKQGVADVGSDEQAGR